MPELLIWVRACRKDAVAFRFKKASVEKTPGATSVHSERTFFSACGVGDARAAATLFWSSGWTQSFGDAKILPLTICELYSDHADFSRLPFASQNSSCSNSALVTAVALGGSNVRASSTGDSAKAGLLPHTNHAHPKNSLTLLASLMQSIPGRLYVPARFCQRQELSLHSVPCSQPTHVQSPSRQSVLV